MSDNLSKDSVLSLLRSLMDEAEQQQQTLAIMPSQAQHNDGSQEPPSEDEDALLQCQSLPKYLEACHTMNQAARSLAAQNNSSSQGVDLAIAGKVHPGRILPSPDFMDNQVHIWKLLLATQDSPFLTDIFPSNEAVHDSYFATELVDGQAKVRPYQRMGMTVGVTTLADRVMTSPVLRQALGVSGHVTYGPLGQDDPVVAQAPEEEAQPLDSSSDLLERFKFCVYSNPEGNRSVPTAVAEYKPSSSSINSVPATVMITQLFDYMIKASVRFGYIYIGEAIVFLEIQDDPSVVHYFVSVPDSDVAGEDETAMYYPAVSQIFAFTMRAIMTAPPSALWHDRVTKLDVWSSSDIDDVLLNTLLRVRGPSPLPVASHKKPAALASHEETAPFANQEELYAAFASDDEADDAVTGHDERKESTNEEESGEVTIHNELEQSAIDENPKESASEEEVGECTIHNEPDAASASDEEASESASDEPNTAFTGHDEPQGESASEVEPAACASDEEDYDYVNVDQDAAVSVDIRIDVGPDGHDEYDGPLLSLCQHLPDEADDITFLHKLRQRLNGDSDNSFLEMLRQQLEGEPADEFFDRLCQHPDDESDSVPKPHQHLDDTSDDALDKFCQHVDNESDDAFLAMLCQHLDDDADEAFLDKLRQRLDGESDAGFLDELRRHLGGASDNAYMCKQFRHKLEKICMDKLQQQQQNDVVDDNGDQGLCINHGRFTKPSQEDRPYCTQECLLGLTNGEALDEACPNAQLHGQEHIDHVRFLELAHNQLSGAGQDSAHCHQTHLTGSMGVLFKLTLESHGYTVVAKAVDESNIAQLGREAQMYAELRAIQGACIPVYLGRVELDEPYEHKGTALRHFILLSWAGRPLKEYWGSETRHMFPTAVWNAYMALHRAGVLHRSAEMDNMLFDHEQNKIMIVDLKRSFVYRCPQTGFEGLNDSIRFDDQGERHGGRRGLRRVPGSRHLRKQFDQAFHMEMAHVKALVNYFVWQL